MKKYLFAIIIALVFIATIAVQMATPESVIKVKDADSSNTFNWQFSHYNFDLDTVVANNITFYLKKDDLYNALSYIRSVNKYDTISSDAIKYHKKYYKFDIYRENNNDVIVFSEFINEEVGREVAIQLTKSDIDKLIADINYSKYHN